MKLEVESGLALISSKIKKRDFHKIYHGLRSRTARVWFGRTCDSLASHCLNLSFLRYSFSNSARTSTRMEAASTARTW